ncbi:tRNA-dihydrouridine(20a/20b) synthase [NAD(P)+]-like protein [Cladochytrium tenue]|nr:tRNA-dihydrouridine(20a/20b) synthase [NAD(P)+]-like protein [Cladochytrium tenue]
MTRASVLALFQERKEKGGYLRICAPMVRYSKVAFRDLVRLYDCDVAYTPMILADVFRNSDIARDSELTTTANDDPVIVQFAASRPEDLADATTLVARYVSGVDLNCGCPQRWAIGEGIGCALMEQRETVHALVRAASSAVAASGARLADGEPPSVSVKIRVHDDLRRTAELVRAAEDAGAAFVAVHGRTRKMRSSEPVDYDAIRTVKKHARVPVVANGDIFTSADADQAVAATGVDGVMAARGLLRNPALFAGHARTPPEAVAEYLRLGVAYRTPPFVLHGHIKFMLEDSMSRAGE